MLDGIFAVQQGLLRKIMDKTTRANEKQLNKEFRKKYGMFRHPLMADIFDVFEGSRAVPNGRTPFNDEIKVVKDVVYKSVNGEDLVMDVYLPTLKLDKHPVVLDIPGGGWMIHNRNRRDGYARLYATMGAVVFVIEHRVSPAVFFPEHLIDVVDAINFLESVKDTYNLDLDKVTVTGDSSGGHLGSLLGVASVNEEYRKKLGLPEVKVKPARQIFISGAFSFDVMYRIPCTHLLIVRYYSGKLSRKAFRAWEFYRESDPYNFITADYPITYNNGGGLDFLCAGEAKRFSKALTKAGVRNDYYVGKNVLNNSHCYVLRLPFKPARQDMLKIMTWYRNEMLSLGIDLTEGHSRVKTFLDNYKKALKGKVKC